MGYLIIYEDDTELAEFEALNKGYRKDVIVVIDKRRYRLYITDIIRLRQDYESEIKSCGYYLNEPNTIIVKEVTKNEIENTILELYNAGFFSQLGYT